MRRIYHFNSISSVTQDTVLDATFTKDNVDHLISMYGGLERNNGELIPLSWWINHTGDELVFKITQNGLAYFGQSNSSSNAWLVIDYIPHTS